LVLFPQVKILDFIVRIEYIHTYIKHNKKTKNHYAPGRLLFHGELHGSMPDSTHCRYAR